MANEATQTGLGNGGTDESTKKRNTQTIDPKPAAAAAGKNAPKEDDDVAGAAASNGDEWTDVQTDRVMYKPEECKGLPLVGYLLSLDDMPESDTGPWQAYVIQTTRDTLGTDFDGNVVQVLAGTEVTITRTTKLEKLMRFLVPGVLIEVSIQPLERVKLDKKRSMWTYSVQANKKSVMKRPPIYAALTNAVAVPKQLGAGSGMADSGLPF